MPIEQLHRKAVSLVNPFLEIVVFRRVVLAQRSPRKAVCHGVSVARYVDKREVEQQDACYPAVDRRVRLDIGVAQHAFDVLRVRLHDKLGEPDQP